MLIGTDKIKVVFLAALLGLVTLSSACAQKSLTAAERARQVEQHQAKAVELQQNGDFQSALAEQQRIVELIPADAGQYIVLAGIYFRLKNYEKAEEAIKKAIELDATEVQAHEVYARILEEVGDEQGVIRERAETVRLDPQNLNSIVNLGVAYDSAGNPDAARQNFERALQINPKYIYALFHLGLLEVEEGNIENAVELLEKVVSLEPTEDEDDFFIEGAKRRLPELRLKLQSQNKLHKFKQSS